jgi:hypothetical protein
MNKESLMIAVNLSLLYSSCVAPGIYINCKKALKYDAHLKTLATFYIIAADAERKRKLL